MWRPNDSDVVRVDGRSYRLKRILTVPREMVRLGTGPDGLPLTRLVYRGRGTDRYVDRLTTGPQPTHTVTAEGTFISSGERALPRVTSLRSFEHAGRHFRDRIGKPEPSSAHSEDALYRLTAQTIWRVGTGAAE